MKNCIIALCIMVGFLIGAWFVGHKKIQETEFTVICTIFFFRIWNLMEVLELKKLAKTHTGH